MYISKKVYTEIKSTIGYLKPECGGIIAVDQNNRISDFYFDADAGYGKISYVPSRIILQNYIRKFWQEKNLQFCGIVHSHPLCNACVPSSIDIKMARKIMAANHMEKLYLLMVKGSEIKLYCVMNENNQIHGSFKEKCLELSETE